MGGCRCTYKNCNNSTKSVDNVHFFHYPVKQKDRCKQWIERAGKHNFFNLDEYQLRNKVVCEAHFEDYCFPNPEKKRLLPNAIPTLDGDNCYDIVSIMSNTKSEYIPKKDFKSVKGDDIQIRPANDDGTLFMLDTLPTFKFSKGVKSYIYSNNAILPIMEPVTLTKELKVKTECEDSINEDEFYELRNGGDVTMDTYENTLVTDPTPEKECNSPVVQFNNRRKEKLKSMSLFENKSPLKKATTENDSLQDIICRTIEDKYMPKIRQNTKDLNSIKRMLKNQRSPRPSKVALVRQLKHSIPPTLYALLNLSLDTNYSLTANDIQFFKLIHAKAPAIYTMLTEEYGWKLPSKHL